MKRIITISFMAILATISLQAECVFQSFVIGQEFSIGNMLEWETTEEFGNKLFIVERSIDGGEMFDEIGQVESQGDSETMQLYTFMDLDARKGRSMYRIKQIDLDEEFGYSSIVVVNKSTDNEFRVAAIKGALDGDNIELSVDVLQELELTYSVLDMKGDVIQEDKVWMGFGLNDIVFDLTAFPDGNYKLALQSGEEVEVLVIRKTISTEESQLPTAKKD